MIDSENKMKVYLRVKYYSYELGDPIWYRAFFDNICYHLEKGKWGSVFPVVMSLYNGEINHKNLDQQDEEITMIKEKFSEIDVNRIIWDIENLSVKCPYLGNLAKDIKTLADFWRTSYESEDMFEVFKRAIQDAKDKKEKI
jgi:hypothetical protein